MTGEPGSTPQGGESRLFTQSELDRIVGERLARERESTEAKLATLTQTISQRTQELEAARSTAGSAESSLKEVLAGLTEAVPESKRSLIPSALPLAEQVKFINQNRAFLLGGEPMALNVSTSTPPPATNIPPPTTQPAASPTAQYGGYKSLTEWAMRDPKGFQEWDRKTPETR